MKTYELHTFRNGQWAFELVFDDNASALEEARRIEKAGQHEVVCVTEENTDESRNVVMSRTIFRAGRRGALKNKSPARTIGTPRNFGSSPTGEKTTVGRERARAKRGASGIAAPIAILVILLFAGATALYGLHQLQ